MVGGIALDRVLVPSPKIVINHPRNMRSYPVKENHNGSAISKILSYKQTNRQISFTFRRSIIYIAFKTNEVPQNKKEHRTSRKLL